MTKKIQLTSKKRTEKNSTLLRQSGQVPAVVYGSGTENVNIQIGSVELAKAFAKAGESTLIDLKIDSSEPLKVIIKDVQIDGVKDVITHVDFFVVDMKSGIEVEIPFVFTGESKAEKEQGGVIVKNMESVLLKCLPGDLIESIEIDLSKLQNIGDHISIADLNLSKNFEVLSDEHTTIVSIIEKKAEIEVPVETAVPDTENIEDGKKNVSKEEKKD